MTHHAKVVIIGSGIVGMSAAYHLTKLGWKDIVVIDKGDLYENDGSTSHAPGGVVPLSHSKIMSQFGLVYLTVNRFHGAFTRGSQYLYSQRPA